MLTGTSIYRTSLISCSPAIAYNIAPLFFSSSRSATRQAISVWIKNRVASSYGAEPARGGPDYKAISPTDRAALKSNILPLLAGSPSRVITVQLASTLKTLISHDFPERWPELLGGAKALLASSNIREVGAGTVVVLEMVRAFRYALVSSPNVVSAGADSDRWIVSARRVRF